MNGFTKQAEAVREQIRFMDAKPHVRGILEDLVDLITIRVEGEEAVEKLNTEHRALVLGQENDRLRTLVRKMEREQSLDRREIERLRGEVATLRGESVVVTHLTGVMREVADAVSAMRHAFNPNEDRRKEAVDLSRKLRDTADTADAARFVPAGGGG